MKKSRFSATMIASILKEFDQGKSVEEISQEHGVSRPTFYKWRQRHDGMVFFEFLLPLNRRAPRGRDCSGILFCLVGAFQLLWLF